MKNTTILFATAITLAVAAMAFPTSLAAPSDPQPESNEQYRPEFEVPVGTVYTGRSPYMRRSVKSSAAPATNPATASAASSAPVFSANSPVSTLNLSYSESAGGLVRLAKSMPDVVTRGSEFEFNFAVTAQDSATNVIVRDTIPAGSAYVRSEPAATVEDNQLVWNIGNMNAGQIIKGKVVFKSDKESALVNDATVSAGDRIGTSNTAGHLVITIEKSGPEIAILGRDITYNIVVKNIGSATAKDVVVTNAVPTGMSHHSGKSGLSFNVGNLAPDQRKSLAVTFKANQRGKGCNIATASSSNAGKVSGDICTTILAPSLKVEKTGTKEQILGRNADYEITVSNTGDTTLTDVTVCDVIPAETFIVTAPGATISVNKTTWTIATLAPGAKATQSVKLTSRTAGTHCDNVTASSGSVTDSAKSCTLWKGVPAVTLEVVDDPDPIQVGENTTYTIRVLNQGSGDIHNLKVTATFDDQIIPVSATQGSVNGKAASFPPINKLSPKQAITYTVTVKGCVVGDSRNKIILTADELKTPVVEEESTMVY